VNARDAIADIAKALPDERIGQLLDYARFLSLQDECTEWQSFGQMQLAKAYGDEEPEYTEVDLLRDNGELTGQPEGHRR
jgi:hypothetical protein